MFPSWFHIHCSISCITFCLIGFLFYLPLTFISFFLRCGKTFIRFLQSWKIRMHTEFAPLGVPTSYKHLYGKVTELDNSDYLKQKFLFKRLLADLRASFYSNREQTVWTRVSLTVWVWDQPPQSYSNFWRDANFTTVKRPVTLRRWSFLTTQDMAIVLSTGEDAVSILLNRVCVEGWCPKLGVLTSIDFW